MKKGFLLFAIFPVFLFGKVQIFKKSYQNITEYIFESSENLKFKLVKSKDENILFFNKKFNVNYSQLSTKDVKVSERKNAVFAISFKALNGLNAHLEQHDNNSLKLIFSKDELDTQIYSTLKDVQYMMGRDLISLTKFGDEEFSIKLQRDFRNDICVFRRGAYVYILIESDNRVNFKLPPKQYIHDYKYFDLKGVQLILIKTDLFVTTKKGANGWKISFSTSPRMNVSENYIGKIIKFIKTPNIIEIPLSESAFFFKIQDPILKDTLVVLPLFKDLANKRLFSSNYFDFLATNQGIAVVLHDENVSPEYIDTKFILRNKEKYSFFIEQKKSQDIVSKISKYLTDAQKSLISLISGELQKSYEFNNDVKRERPALSYSCLNGSFGNINWAELCISKKLYYDNENIYNSSEKSIDKYKKLFDSYYFEESYNCFFDIQYKNFVGHDIDIKLLGGINAFLLHKFYDAKCLLESSVYYNEKFVKLLLNFIDSENENTCYIDVKDMQILDAFNDKIAKQLILVMLDDKYHLTNDIKEVIIKRLGKCELSKDENALYHYYNAQMLFYKKKYDEALSEFDLVDLLTPNIMDNIKIFKTLISFNQKKLNEYDAVQLIEKFIVMKPNIHNELKSIYIDLLLKTNQLFKILPIMSDENDIKDFLDDHIKQLISESSKLELIELYYSYKKYISDKDILAISLNLLDETFKDIALDIMQNLCIDTKKLEFINFFTDIFSLLIDSESILDFLELKQKNLGINQHYIDNKKVVIYYNANEYNKVTDLYQKNAKIFTSLKNIRLLANSYYMISDFESAERLYRDLLQKYNSSDYNDLLYLISIMASVGKRKEALKEYLYWKERINLTEEQDDKLRYLIYLSKENTI